MDIKGFILSTLSDEVGKISHKRIIGIIASFVLFIAFFTSKDANVKIHLSNLIFGLAGLCFGFATWDKLSNR